MPNSDQFGALTFPVPVAAPNQPSGDPAIGYLLSYLKTAINAACGEVWNSICAGRKPVDFTFPYDPKKLFNEVSLPALYAWRGKSRRARLGDDLYVRTSQVQIAWIHEPGSEDLVIATRDSAMNAIANAIDNALTSNRHPDWIVDVDQDPITQMRGSSLDDMCGWSRCQPSNDGPSELLFQRVENAAPEPYYGFVLEVECDEYQTKALQNPIQSRANVTLTTNDGLITNAVEQS